MIDYTKFLGKTDEAVLAYLGGPHVFGEGRRLRVEGARPALGFHRFEISGRSARALGAVEVDLDTVFKPLPKVRGHHVAGFVCAQKIERIRLMPAEELAPFAIVRARRWHSSDLVFESLDFDGEAEENARLALERLVPLEGKGVPASLRVAYGVALAVAIGRRLEIPISVTEALTSAVRIADEGEAAARAFLTDLAERRAAEAARTRIHAIAFGRRPAAPIPIAKEVPLRDRPTLDNAHVRADLALDAARARMLSSRLLGDGNLEVAFEFMGERFVSVVDAITLHVYDSGVCLAGADELVTLESLPSVIREAIEDDLLVITRR